MSTTRAHRAGTALALVASALTALYALDYAVGLPFLVVLVALVALCVAAWRLDRWVEHGDRR